MKIHYFLILLFTGLNVSIHAQTTPIYESMEEAMLHPEEVIKLDLVSMELDSFPEGIREMKNLKYLLLEDNNITTIPAWITELSALEELGLDGNKLTEIPAFLGDLSNLEYLGLDDNGLKYLPDELLNLSSLQELYLNLTNLSVYPIHWENGKNWIGWSSTVTS